MSNTTVNQLPIEQWTDCGADCRDRFVAVMGIPM